MRRCDTCLYQDRHTCTCDFYLMTGQRRKSPVEDCERWNARNGRNHVPHIVVAKEPAKKQEKPTKRQLRWQKMRDLYDAGKNDSEIAREVGLTSAAVGIWRRRNDLPRLFLGRPRKKVEL